MTLDRHRGFHSLLRALVVTGVVLTSAYATAGAWPDGTVRMLTPSAPGGSIDVAARLLGERLAARWHHPVVIENRPGADGILAVQALLQATDGRTLLFAFPGVVTVVPLLHDRLSYDPATDLLPIASLADDVLALAVNARIPVASLDELVRYANARPSELNWSAAPGAPYLTFLEFEKRARVQMTYVPYRSPVLALPDLINDRIQIAITPLGGALALTREGKIKLLAITARERSPAAPDISSALEAGHPEMTIQAPLGLFGPKTMPLELREHIAADVRAAASDPAIIQRLGALGMIVRAGTPNEYAATLAEQRTHWTALAHAHGLQPR
jgi:tripartite-type tricarboxylate transporter receptor subunit TctC